MAFSLSDIIDLAKAGYKPADVRELIQLSKEAAAPVEPDKPAPEIKDDAKKATDDDQGKAAADVPDDKAGSVDYKALYEQEHAALEKLQQENINKNNEQPAPDLDEILADAMRGYM